MPLRLRHYAFLEPGLRAGGSGRRARVTSAILMLLVAGAGIVAGYAFGLGGRQAPRGAGARAIAVAASAEGGVLAVANASPARPDADVLRTELARLTAENTRLLEEQRAYQAMLDPRTGVGREVSVAPVTVRPVTGGWRFFALVSGGAAGDAPFRGNLVVELAGAPSGDGNERVLADVPARSLRVDYRNGQIVTGELAASGSVARALRLSVVDDNGRTRATQRVGLP